MFIYNVTVQIDNLISDEWLLWMKKTHIPDVLKTNCFTGFKILKLLNDNNAETTYIIQYYFESINDYNVYLQKHAPLLQKEHSIRYQNKFVAFRTLLEIMGE